MSTKTVSFYSEMKRFLIHSETERLMRSVSNEHPDQVVYTVYNKLKGEDAAHLHQKGILVDTHL